MKISNVRIDARGIHGQVATAWVSSLNVNRIMVIDDHTVKNEMQKMALKMACPNGVKLSILSCEKAVSRLTDPSAYVGEQLMIILLQVETLEKLKNLDYNFKAVTVGNIPSRPGTEAVRKNIYLTQKEKEIFRNMSEAGTYFIAQMVPNDAAVELMSLMKF